MSENQPAPEPEGGDVDKIKETVATKLEQARSFMSDFYKKYLGK